jgi:enediyne biosynthesis protein E4
VRNPSDVAVQHGVSEPAPPHDGVLHSNEVRAPLRFTDISGSVGIDFQHISGDCEQKPFPAANGSGVAAFDFDLDGWFDLLFLNGTSFPINEIGGGTGDACFRNRRALSFSNVTAVTGLGAFGYSAGAVTGDFNCDGFPDVFVNCFGKNRFYFNQGDGSFLESAQECGLQDPAWGTSAAALDFDNDGDLDLYACNYAEWDWETNPFCGDRQKNIRIFCSPRSVKPVADRLFENLGDGRFRDVLVEVGIGREPARGQGVIAADIDDDGLTDLYVGNDMNTNSLFRNKGDGTFEDLTDISGAGVDFAGQIQAGMGVDIADVDRDGLVEIFVTNYEGEHNAFYQNLGRNVFQDSSQSRGLAAPSMKWVGWGTRFSDLDLDGWTDLVITNGHTDNNLQKMGRDSVYEQPPLLFRNENGRLMPVASPADSYFGTSHPGRSLCVVDLDRNLTPDIVVGHKDQPPAILRNDSDTKATRNVICLSFIGTRVNRDGIGVGVEVLGATPVMKSQIKSGGSYLSSDPCTMTLSLSETDDKQLKIRWPGGQTQNLAVPREPGRYTVVEGRGAFVANPL